MKKLLISAVLSSALLISGSLSAKTLKFQISSKAGDWAHTYLNTKNKVLEELTNGELKIDPLPTKSVVPHRETIDAVANGILDGDMNAIAYFAGRDPAFAIMGDFNIAPNAEDVWNEEIMKNKVSFHPKEHEQ